MNAVVSCCIFAALATIASAQVRCKDNIDCYPEKNVIMPENVISPILSEFNGKGCYCRNYICQIDAFIKDGSLQTFNCLKVENNGRAPPPPPRSPPPPLAQPQPDKVAAAAAAKTAAKH